MAAKTLVLVNPTAGGGRAQRALPQVADYLRRQGLVCEFVEAQSAEDVQRRAAEGVAAGYARIVALGGEVHLRTANTRRRVAAASSDRRRRSYRRWIRLERRR